MKPKLDMFIKFKNGKIEPVLDGLDSVFNGKFEKVVRVYIPPVRYTKNPLEEPPDKPSFKIKIFQNFGRKLSALPLFEEVGER